MATADIERKEDDPAEGGICQYPDTQTRLDIDGVRKRGWTDTEVATATSVKRG